jgi:hypothetical protein
VQEVHGDFQSVFQGDFQGAFQGAFQDSRKSRLSAGNQLILQFPTQTAPGHSEFRSQEPKTTRVLKIVINLIKSGKFGKFRVSTGNPWRFPGSVPGRFPGSFPRSFQRELSRELSRIPENPA